MIYVSHKYGGFPYNLSRAREVVHDLQIKDTENVYICPLLVFSAIEYGEMDKEEQMLLCEDLLCCCDKLIIASEVTDTVQREIDLAKRLGMEVVRLETA